jgi:RNA polymerase subunit RPABC4/transcription elongation factor Spt4
MASGVDFAKLGLGVTPHSAPLLSPVVGCYTCAMATTKACPACQAEISDSSRFCPQCGAPQSLACGACGHANEAGSHFCAKCGAKLDEASPAAAPPKPAPLIAAPPRAASTAQRRQLTVMFCDLVGLSNFICKFMHSISLAFQLGQAPSFCVNIRTNFIRSPNATNFPGHSPMRDWSGRRDSNPRPRPWQG